MFGSQVCTRCRLLLAFGGDGKRPFKDFFVNHSVETAAFLKYEPIRR
jgi:hypothetical protein